MLNFVKSRLSGKILLFSGFIFLLSVNVFAQYPEVTIKDIQYQPNILITGDQPSPLNGDTVTITCGVVMVAPYKDANPDSGVTLNSGAPALILQDTSDAEWGGILVRYENMPAGNPFAILDTGTVIKCTGYVYEYFKTTEFNLISFEASDVLGFMQRPKPIKITLDSLAQLGGREGKLLAERWEEVFIEVDTVTATNGGVGSGSYEIFDENNTQVIVYGNRSYYYYNGVVPTPGTVLKHVTGFIETRDNVPNITFANLIDPVYPGDVETLLFAPNISNLVRNPVLVGYGDNVTVSATIIDQDGTIDTAKLYYRINNGSNTGLTMTNTGGDTWQAIIPALNDSSVVDFFVYAKDNDNNKSLYPADTTHDRYFYLVLNRDLTIQDVQFSPFGGGYSAYSGYTVTVSGIVTADTTDIEGNETGTASSPQVYIQNGQGPWSGVHIFGTEPANRRRGDYVTVTGPVVENYGVTQIGSNSVGASVVVNSTGNPLPLPEVRSTAEIDSITDGGVQAEQWEGVLLKYENVTVINENADGNPGPDEGTGGNRNYGDILVANTSNIYTATRVDLQDGTHIYHNFWKVGQDTIPIYVKQGYTFESITGVLWFSFGYYKLIPRKNDDFSGLSDVENNVELPEKYSLSQNYPNPFNPSTKINYSLPVEGNVSLKIYDILGREIRTLINNETKTAGQYTINFDARNLPSGIYIYRLQAGDFSQVKKMILLK
jgi:hypothetical protein